MVIEIILTGLATILCFQLYVLFCLFKVVANFKIRVPEIDIISEPEESEKNILSKYQARLEALGFEFVAFRRINPSVSFVDNCSFTELLFFNTEQHCCAEIYRMPHVDPKFSEVVSFSTKLSNSKVFFSTNQGRSRFLERLLPSYSFNNQLGAELEELWKCHLDARPERGLRLEGCASKFTENDKREWRRIYQGIVSSNVLKESGDGRYMLTLVESLRVTWQEYVRSKTIVPEQPEVSLFDRVKAYEDYLEATQAKSQNKKSVLVLLGVSVLLFILSFSLHLSLAEVGILVFVIFIHELGHLVAMKRFGYENLKMIFVPFFGALAVSKSKAVSSYKKVIIDLAGPMPGIFIGFILSTIYLFNPHDLLLDFAISFVALNFINLLPIYPLDGGQVVNEVLVYKYPRVASSIAVLGALSLIAMGLYFDSSIEIVFGAIMLFTARASSAQSVIISKLNKLKDLPSVADVFQEIDKTPLSKKPAADQYEAVRAILFACSAPKSKPWVDVALLGSYVGLVIGTAAGAYGLYYYWAFCR